METNIEKYVEELEKYLNLAEAKIDNYNKSMGLLEIEIHKLRNKAQVAYAMVGEAVIFFEAVKADFSVPEELRKLAKIWLTDYYEFFPQPEPIHTGNK